MATSSASGSVCFDRGVVDNAAIDDGSGEPDPGSGASPAFPSVPQGALGGAGASAGTDPIAQAHELAQVREMDQLGVQGSPFVAHPDGSVAVQHTTDVPTWSERFAQMYENMLAPFWNLSSEFIKRLWQVQKMLRLENKYWNRDFANVMETEVVKIQLNRLHRPKQ